MLLGMSSTSECLPGLSRRTVDTPLRQPGHDRPARGVSLGIPVGQHPTSRNRDKKPHKMRLRISPFWAGG